VNGPARKTRHYHSGFCERDCILTRQVGLRGGQAERDEAVSARTVLKLTRVLDRAAQAFH